MSLFDRASAPVVNAGDFCGAGRGRAVAIDSGVDPRIGMGRLETAPLRGRLPRSASKSAQFTENAKIPGDIFDPGAFCVPQ